MNTSSRFIVALHVMTIMASKLLTFGRGASGLCNSDELATSVNTNPVFIRRLLAQLGKAGLVITERGRKGGTSLAKPPAAISLLDIYNAVEKGSVFQMHHGNPNAYCPVGSNIQECVLSVFNEAENAMKKVLEERSVEAVALEIIEMSGIRNLIDQGLSYEEVKLLMMEKAGIAQA